jgi:hypothetical protein
MRHYLHRGPGKVLDVITVGEAAGAGSYPNGSKSTG